MDMRYHWLPDMVRQKQFDVYWRPGRGNLDDYHTKYHSAQHHKDMHGLILHQANSLQVLRGCVLGKTLEKFPTIFGGGLGMLNIKPVRLYLIDGAKYYHAIPFPVTQLLEATTKT
jgi:hypothetical protein